MIGSSRKLCAFLVIPCFILIIFVLRSSIGFPSTIQIYCELSPHRRPDNASRTQQEAPRLLQASFFFSNPDENTTELYEKYIDICIQRGVRWGYPTYILRHEISTEEDQQESLLFKVRHLSSLLVGELAKPHDERAEWIMLVFPVLATHSVSNHVFNFFYAFFSPSRRLICPTVRYLSPSTISLNTDIPWTHFLPPRSFPQVHFLGAKDQQGFHDSIFFLRVHEWSVNFLNDVAAQSLLSPELHSSSSAEEDAMSWVLDRWENRDHVRYRPQNCYNGFSSVCNDEAKTGVEDQSENFNGTSKDSNVGAISRWFDSLHSSTQDASDTSGSSVNPAILRSISAFWSRLGTADDLWKASLNFQKATSPTAIGKSAAESLERAQIGLQIDILQRSHDDMALEHGIRQLRDALQLAENGRIKAQKTSAEPENSVRRGGRRRKESELR